MKNNILLIVWLIFQILFGFITMIMYYKTQDYYFGLGVFMAGLSSAFVEILYHSLLEEKK